VPGIVHLEASLRAGGRIEQPLTYWNAMGALAALGVVLCARLAGDATRSRALRAGAAAAAGPLGMGAYLSFSRGALACLVVGVAALVLLAPTWRQLHAALVVLEAAAVGAIVAAPFDAVRALAPSPSSSQGAIVLALLLGAMGAAALVHRAVCRAEARGALRAGPLPLGGRRRALATAAVVAIAAAPYALALTSGSDGSSSGFGASSSRLSDVGSHRSAYWRVAVQTWADHPLAGAGAGSFGTEWLERRHIDERVQDAHSLYLETPAELGLVGLVLLLTLAGGVAAAARAALRADRVLAAGPVAALSAGALHAGLDWDWEMPALTLVAVVLAGVLLCGREPAAADGPRDLGDEPALEGDAEPRRDDAEQRQLADRLRLGAR
jgi:O-Antigen ligase